MKGHPAQRSDLAPVPAAGKLLYCRPRSRSRLHGWTDTAERSGAERGRNGDGVSLEQRNYCRPSHVGACVRACVQLLLQLTDDVTDRCHVTGTTADANTVYTSKSTTSVAAEVGAKGACPSLENRLGGQLCICPPLIYAEN